MKPAAFAAGAGAPALLLAILSFGSGSAGMSFFHDGRHRRDMDPCVTGLHMIVARGTGEPVGAGRMGAIASAVAAVIPGSKVVGLDYPAQFRNYVDSEGAGVDALRAAVGNYTMECPNTKVALLGYSQVRFWA
jgi:hypothetical protein